MEEVCLMVSMDFVGLHEAGLSRCFTMILSSVLILMLSE